MKSRRILHVVACLLASWVGDAFTEEKIRVGVPIAFSGEFAAIGEDIKNSLTLMNDLYGEKRYEFIFVDEGCNTDSAVSAARKLTQDHKVKYALGFSCNAGLVAAAPLYERADVMVIASGASSEDVVDLGSKIFRIFPSRVLGSHTLFDAMVRRHKKVGILSEDNADSALIERAMLRRNETLGGPLELFKVTFAAEDFDLRGMIIDFQQKGVDGLFLNATTPDQLANAAQAARDAQFTGALYAFAPQPLQELAEKHGESLEGVVFLVLPDSEELMSGHGHEYFSAFKKRYGSPKSTLPVVTMTLEAFRIFHQSLNTDRPAEQFVAETGFAGFHGPDCKFDEHGALEGLHFKFRTVEKGKIVVLPDEKLLTMR